VRLPLAAVRIGRDLTFLAMGGEVVVDYALRFKREFGDHHPWLVGYAYEVPCYIPSVRLLREGGYEPHASLIYYGIYGPFRPALEQIIAGGMADLVRQVQTEVPSAP
jgi:neutral ceramidase